MVNIGCNLTNTRRSERVEGACNGNRPKRRKTRRLGHRCIFLLFSFVYLNTKAIFCVYRLLFTKYKRRGRWKPDCLWTPFLILRAKSRARFDFSKVACDFGVYIFILIWFLFIDTISNWQILRGWFFLFKYTLNI